MTVFLGDDITDEDGFKALAPPDGWGIFVGDENTPSAADSFLRSVPEVEELLDRLIQMG
jgi:trehalose-6-phosphatase